MNLESILSDLMESNQRDRTRFERLAFRTVGAIGRNTPNDFDGIIRDATIGEATDSETSNASGSESVEAGDVDGTAGNPIVATPSG